MYAELVDLDAQFRVSCLDFTRKVLQERDLTYATHPIDYLQESIAAYYYPRLSRAVRAGGIMLSPQQESNLVPNFTGLMQGLGEKVTGIGAGTVIIGNFVDGTDQNSRLYPPALKLYSELIRRAEINPNRAAIADALGLAGNFNLELLRMRINELLLADYLCPVYDSAQDNCRGIVDFLFPELARYKMDELTGVEMLGIDFVINNPELIYAKTQTAGSCAYKRYIFRTNQVERSLPFPEKKEERLIFKRALEKSLLALADGVISQLTPSNLYEARMNGRSNYFNDLRRGDKNAAAVALAAYELLTEAHEAIHMLACSAIETTEIINSDISYRRRIAKAGFLRLGIPWRS